MDLVRWMKDYSRDKRKVGAGKELGYVFVQADLYEGLVEHFGVSESRSRGCVAYANKIHGAFCLEEFDVWVMPYSWYEGVGLERRWMMGVWVQMSCGPTCFLRSFGATEGIGVLPGTIEP